MDDQDVVNGVSFVAITLTLAAMAWLLLSPRHGTSGGNQQLRAGYRNSRSTLDARHRPLGQIRRCREAVAAAGDSGCLAATFAPTTRPGRRVQVSTRPAAVTPALSQVPASAPTNLPPTTVQPTPPASPALTPRASSAAGPVPGGSTNPPHTGPSP